MTTSPDDDVVTVRTVRPYTLTGGRTRSSGRQVPFEAIVHASGSAVPATASAERRAIVALAGEQVLSLAEISAHLKLPLVVTRVLVGDLADEGLLTVGGEQSDVTLSADDVYPSSDAHLLETVLDALTAL